MWGYQFANLPQDVLRKCRQLSGFARDSVAGFCTLCAYGVNCWIVPKESCPKETNYNNDHKLDIVHLAGKQSAYSNRLNLRGFVLIFFQK